MKKALLIFLLGISLHAFSNGDPSRITTSLIGNVKEYGSPDLLTGVRITVKGMDIFTYSDKDGNFVLPEVPVGEIELVFSLVSFEPKTLKLAPFSPESTPLSIELISR